MKPLFIPLNRQYFEAFERGHKTTEYRLPGGRWNENTCAVGRPVTLSMGYGKARRLSGVVTGFSVHALHDSGWLIFKRIYPGKPNLAACIEIKVTSLLTV